MEAETFERALDILLANYGKRHTRGYSAVAWRYTGGLSINMYPLTAIRLVLQEQESRSIPKCNSDLHVLPPILSISHVRTSTAEAHVLMVSVRRSWHRLPGHGGRPNAWTAAASAEIQD